MIGNGELALAVLAAIVVEAAAAFWWTQRPPAIGRRVVANLTDGGALRGILTRQRGSWLVLHDAAYLSNEPTATTGPVPVDGAVHIERPRILFLQVLP